MAETEITKGSRLKAKPEAGGKWYVVQSIDKDEICLKSADNSITIDIYLEDIPVIFEITGQN